LITGRADEDANDLVEQSAIGAEATVILTGAV
jgi:hypothetical protein